MIRGTDGNGAHYINWETGDGGFKRAWIQHRTGDRDWAGTGRYLNVVRTDTLEGGPSGNATDFPVYNELPDRQVLEAFVAAVSAITGCKLPEAAYPSN
jgi:hypothetical protein